MRIFILLLAMTIITSGQAFNLTLKAGYDFAGEHKVDTQYEIEKISDKIDNSFSAAMEGTFTVGRIFDLGAGVAYRAARNGKSINDLELTIIPVYSIIKINLLTVPTVNPQFIGHIGHSSFTTGDRYKDGREAKGGTYFALGFGLNPVSDFYTEILFSASNFYYNKPGGNESTEHKLQYTCISLYAGWRF